MKIIRIVFFVFTFIVFFASSYFAYNFANNKYELVEDNSVRGSSFKKNFPVSTSVSTSMDSGLNGGAIGFSVIAASSLICMTIIILKSSEEKNNF